MVLIEIDIPLTLILIGLGTGFIIIWLGLITNKLLRTYKQVNKFIKFTETFLSDVPIVSPGHMEDLLKRNDALQHYIKTGDRTRLTAYWDKKFEEKEMKV